jgi:hypothetical protein
MEKTDISLIVNKALDEELAQQEENIAKTHGAVANNGPITEKIEEIQELNSELASDSSIKPEQKVEEVIIPAEKKKVLKKELIKSIMELQATMKEENPFTERALRAKNKDELETLLAGLFEKGQKQVENVREVRAQNSTDEENTLVGSLYLMNLMLAGALEKISDKFKDQTYNIALLDGMTKKMIETRAELLEILRKIYGQHTNIVKKIASPLILYCGYMANTAVFTIFENLEKKKLASTPK